MGKCLEDVGSAVPSFTNIYSLIVSNGAAQGGRGKAAMMSAGANLFPLLVARKLLQDFLCANLLAIRPI